MRHAKMCSKRVDLHRSLKVNSDHFIKLYFYMKISTGNVSTIYFAEMLL